MTVRLAVIAILVEGLACSGVGAPAPAPAPAVEAPAPEPARQGKAGKRGKHKAGAGKLDPVADWPQMDVSEFGCMLSGAGGAVDPKWACGAPAPPHGDPCKDTDDYYAGPKFPPPLVAGLPIQATRVDLKWEGGALQSMTIELAPGVDGAAALKTLGLDGERPANIDSVNVQDCSKGSQCLGLIGYVHMGAGEVDCGEN